MWREQKMESYTGSSHHDYYEDDYVLGSSQGDMSGENEVQKCVHKGRGGMNWIMSSSGIWSCVDFLWSDVSEEPTSSIFGVEKSASEKPSWTVCCNLPKKGYPMRQKDAQALVEWRQYFWISREENCIIRFPGNATRNEQVQD